MFQQFLAVTDAARALHTLQRLARHHVEPWAITGGFAVEIHHGLRGRQSFPRPLNDIDFIAGSFDCIPGTLADNFLFRHIHPLAPPGKIMLQFVDPDSALRVDVFRACSATMNRASRQDLESGTLQLVSIEDLLARVARLTLDLAQRVPMPSKHAKDFLRLMELVNPRDVETAWQDHRKPTHSRSFAETNRLLQDLIPTCPHLLMTPDYSHDIEKVCTQCKPTSPFRLADPAEVLSLLGYC